MAFKPATVNVYLEWYQWATLAMVLPAFAFIGGQLYRRLTDVAGAVKVPVLAIFGKQAESPSPSISPDTADDFRAVRSDWSYAVIDGAGLSVQREAPAEVAARILAFAK